MTRDPADEYESALGLAWLGPEGNTPLLKRLGDLGLQRVWTAPKAAMLSWGLGAGRVEQLCEARRRFDFGEARTALQRIGQRFVPYGSESYPSELLRLDAPPAGLFVCAGEQVLERFSSAPRVTVVGTRKASTDGVAAAAAFCEALSRRGVAVVSGMALGIDGIAHEASLKAGGLTVAVLGCGADVIYPSRHRWLYEKIVSNGAVISELPPGSHPTKWTFPHRNRLLAAMCDAVLVVEAPRTSGALQTAGWGLDLGRDVFAVPGPISRASCEGSNLLVYEGAYVALAPETMVEDFLRVTRMERGGRDGVHATRVAVGEQLRLSETTRDDTPVSRVLAALSEGPSSVDGLSEASGLSVRTVSSVLGELEIRGAVARAGPGMYRRAR